MKQGRWGLFFGVLFFLIQGGAAYTAPLRITVSQPNTAVAVTVGQIDLTGNGGSDIGETETAANVKTIDVRIGVNNWRIDVSKADTLWDAGIVLYIKRTGGGTGIGPFTGGLVYQEVTNTDATFVSGKDNTTNMPIQFKLGGGYASAGLSTGVYTTTITYTVTDGLP